MSPFFEIGQLVTLLFFMFFFVFIPVLSLNETIAFDLYITSGKLDLNTISARVYSYGIFKIIIKLVNIVNYVFEFLNKLILYSIKNYYCFCKYIQVKIYNIMKILAKLY